MSVVSRQFKVGLGIAVFLAAADLAALLLPTPEGEDGPPYFILVFAGLMGLVTMVAAYLARRGDRKATLAVVVSRVLSVLTSLPAFLVDIPVAIKVLVAAAFVLTAVSVWLLLKPQEEAS
jgi:hypothetical protein